MQSDKLLNWAKEYKIDEILQNRETLQNLKSLDLSFKNLNSIPKYVFELSSLEDLNLSHNQLEELPIEILELKILKSLDISWNRITHSLNFLSSNIKINSAWNRK